MPSRRALPQMSSLRGAGMTMQGVNLYSPDGAAYIVLQTDGNLVL